MPEARVAFRPFPEQLAFFQRKINVPTARWDDLREGDHAHGFMVAGLARQDVLDDMRDAIERSIRDGETLADFRGRFDSIVAGRWEGFTGDGSARGRAWRTRIIYQTNLRTSYMAGRWERLRQFPFLRYNHHTILNPREAHQAWNGLIIATDDPWWGIHYPPNGWGCRCDATGVSEQRLRSLGRQADAAPAPIEGDPPQEWAYHVGTSARSLPVASAFGERVMQLPPAWRAQALADAQRRTPDLYRDWGAVISEITAGAAVRATGAAAPVGLLPDAVVLAIDPRTALLAATDRPIAAAIRAGGDLGGEVATAARALPAAIADPAAAWRLAADDSLVLLQPLGGQFVMYTFSRGDGVRRGQVRALWLRQVDVIDASALADLRPLPGGP